VYAFDLTTSGLMRASAYGHPLVRADITRVPFAADTFDLATSFDVLQSVPDAAAAIRDIARIVRPGGAVVMTVSALEILRGDHAEGWKEVERFSSRRLRELVEGAGLQVERLSFLFASLVPMLLVVRVAQRLTRRFRSSRSDADISVPAAPLNAMFTGLLKTEAALSRHLSMPFGSSLLVVARKR
jgi:ubiquinone/menaquinone biosynthesis C-methylase UbiE